MACRRATIENDFTAHDCAESLFDVADGFLQDLGDTAFSGR
jgi:hypothetical protein